MIPGERCQPPSAMLARLGRQRGAKICTPITPGAHDTRYAASASLCTEITLRDLCLHVGCMCACIYESYF